MRNRHTRVLGLLCLTISIAAPIFAQTRTPVDAPADGFGRRVKVTSQGAGGSPDGTFTSGTHQIGGRPDPFSWAPAATTDCASGPFPSGFSIEMIGLESAGLPGTVDFDIEFKAAKDCSALAKPGTYSATESPTSPTGGFLKIISSKFACANAAGTGTMKVNSFDVYGRRLIGALFTVGYLDADFTFTCSGTTTTGKVLYSQDSIPAGAELLNPDGGGGVGGGSPSEPLPPVDPPDAVAGFPSTSLESGLQMTNDSTATVPVSVATQNGFIGDVDIEAVSDATDAEGLTVSLSQNHFASPGNGNSTLTIRVGPNTFPRDYFVTVVTTANGKQGFNTIRVTVLCDPPMILGVDQPRGASFSGSGSATLETRAVGSGPLTYQWFSGPRGSTNFPVSGGTSARLTTNNEGMYWVRVGNACGAVDSAPALVTRQ